MIGKVVGALFGAEMERRRGGRGAAGALVGLVATGVVRRMGPLGLMLGGAYVAKQAYDRRREVRRPGGDRDARPTSPDARGYGSKSDASPYE